MLLHDKQDLPKPPGIARYFEISCFAKVEGMVSEAVGVAGRYGGCKGLLPVDEGVAARQHQVQALRQVPALWWKDGVIRGASRHAGGGDGR